MKPLWSLVCLAGVWGFVLSGVGLTLQGFPARDRLDRGRALRWGSLLLGFFLLWLVGMWRA